MPHNIVIYYMKLGTLRVRNLDTDWIYIFQCLKDILIKVYGWILFSKTNVNSEMIAQVWLYFSESKCIFNTKPSHKTSSFNYNLIVSSDKFLQFSRKGVKVSIECYWENLRKAWAWKWQDFQDFYSIKSIVKNVKYKIVLICLIFFLVTADMLFHIVNIFIIHACSKTVKISKRKEKKSQSVPTFGW